MTARAEVEDMLAEAAWRERNGLEQSATMDRIHVAPIDMVREHEAKAYRDEPPADAYDNLPVVPLGWALVIALVATVAVVWGLCHLLGF